MIPNFRAWDKEDKEMLEVHGINFDANGIWTREMIDDESDGNFLFLDEVELMQSTGVKDKNGVEIFESEIVNIRTIQGEIYLRGVVKKVKGGFYIERLYNSKIIPLTDFYFKSYTNTLKIEIIGNKYEHPHLIEE
jgi:uncharacterized phage protein (TIGR01671 family)